jgi:hypothetical protein
LVTQKEPKRLWQLLAILVSIPVFVMLAANHLSMVDDAYITMRYAQHWLETGKLTWHVGLPMVDGYTSLAHVCLLAIGGRLGFDLVDVNAYLNLASFLGILIVYGLACRQQAVTGWPSVAGLYVIVLNSSFAFWVTGGLDGLLWALGTFVTYIECERSLADGRFRARLVMALLTIVLIRPEGTFIALGVTVYVLSYVLRHQAPTLWRIALPALIVAVGIAALYAWRLDTYGHLFPNAFYAKNSASRWSKVQTGLRYLMLWFSFYGGVLGLSIFIGLKRSFFENTRVYFILGLVLMVVVEGGDPHQQMRFFLPVVPLLALHVAAVLQNAPIGQNGPIGTRVLVGVLVCLSLVARFSGKEPWQDVFPLNSDTRVEELMSPTRPATAIAVGLRNLWSGEWPLRKSNYEHWNAAASRRLGELLRPGLRVAATDVGALAYFSHLEILDAQGLNDREIAHLPKPVGLANLWGVEHWEIAVARGIDVIVPGFLRYVDVRLTDLRVDELTEKEWDHLFTRPLPELFVSIRGTFTCVSVEDPHHSGRYLNLLVRREHIARVWRMPPMGVSTADCWQVALKDQQ